MVSIWIFIMASSIRNKLFGPLDFSRRDLAALNIMRGRDSGLPDYNTIRKYYHLPRVSNWSDINPGLYNKDQRWKQDFYFETYCRLIASVFGSVMGYTRS